MRISSGNDNEGLSPELIPWSTNEAPFLPFYIGGILFTLFIGIPHLATPYPYLAALPALVGLYLIYKTFRAIEAHRNLKRLDRLYEELKAKR